MNASVACGFAPHDRAEPELFGSEYGTWFEDRLVVEAYPARPPYPSALIAHLVGLSGEEPRAVLDVGCGPGDLARPLAAQTRRSSRHTR